MNLQERGIPIIFISHFLTQNYPVFFLSDFGHPGVQYLRLRLYEIFEALPIDPQRIGVPETCDVNCKFSPAIVASNFRFVTI